VYYKSETVIFPSLSPFHHNFHSPLLLIPSTNPQEYGTQQEKESVGEYDLSSGFTVQESEKAKQENLFEITTDSGSFLLAADSQQEMKDWVQVLSKYATSPESDDEEPLMDISGINMQAIIEVLSLFLLSFYPEYFLF